MSVNGNGNLRPDGAYLSWTPSVPRLGQIGVGGTWYWNPGVADAPRVTVTGSWGKGRDVWKFGPPQASFNGGLVFRRNGMTSADTLGWGTNSNVSTVVPSVSVNTSMPDRHGIPQPTKNKVSSIEVGLSGSVGASRATTYTVTPQQIVEFLKKNRFIQPAMGPEDELSPFQRSLQSGFARIGPVTEDPVPYVRSPSRPFGAGTAPWASGYFDGRYGAAAANNPGGNADHIFSTGTSAVPFLPNSGSSGGPAGATTLVTGDGGNGRIDPRAGGLLGMIQDYLSSEAARGGSR